MFEAAGELPQFLAVLRANEGGEESSVIEPDASGAFGFSGSRSGPRSVLLWSTPMSNAQFSFHWKPCVRPKFANVRGPNSVACELILDLTCVRSQGRVRMPMRVVSASICAPSACSYSANSVVSSLRR